jgi:hypothetical protein
MPGCSAGWSCHCRQPGSQGHISAVLTSLLEYHPGTQTQGFAYLPLGPMTAYRPLVILPLTWSSRICTGEEMTTRGSRNSRGLPQVVANLNQLHLGKTILLSTLHGSACTAATRVLLSCSAWPRKDERIQTTLPLMAASTGFKTLPRERHSRHSLATTASKAFNPPLPKSFQSREGQTYLVLLGRANTQVLPHLK